VRGLGCTGRRMCRGKEDVHDLVLFACLSIHSVGWVRGRERASRVCRRVERVDSVFACSMCAREREREGVRGGGGGGEGENYL